MERPEQVYPLVYLAARPGPTSRLYAPFWRLEGRARWRVDDSTKDRAYQNLRRLGPLYFPAFWTPRVGHDENLTFRYGLLDSRPPEDPDARGDVLPGVLDPETLPEMARLTWLAHLDRVADVTGVQLEFSPGSVVYAAVPFLRSGASWEDGVLGLRFPDAYFGTSAP
jgi:hypothetical protein